eukprot:scaffold431_cov315-Prasinococcus_capsulatus_cf.AAC.9
MPTRPKGWKSPCWSSATSSDSCTAAWLPGGRFCAVSRCIACSPRSPSLRPRGGGGGSSTSRGDDVGVAIRRRPSPPSGRAPRAAAPPPTRTSRRPEGPWRAACRLAPAAGRQGAYRRAGTAAWRTCFHRHQPMTRGFDQPGGRESANVAPPSARPMYLTSAPPSAALRTQSAPQLVMLPRVASKRRGADGCVRASRDTPRPGAASAMGHPSAPPAAPSPPAHAGSLLGEGAPALHVRGVCRAGARNAARPAPRAVQRARGGSYSRLVGCAAAAFNAVRRMPYKTHTIPVTSFQRSLTRVEICAHIASHHTIISPNAALSGALGHRPRWRAPPLPCPALP